VGRCEVSAGGEEEGGGEAGLYPMSVSVQAGCDMLCACMTAMPQVDEQRISGSSEQQRT
jgi:hypothetical protein